MVIKSNKLFTFKYWGKSKRNCCYVESYFFLKDGEKTWGQDKKKNT